MIRVMNGEDEFTQVESVTEYQVLLDDLYPEGVPDDVNLVLHPKDLWLYNKSKLSDDIDEALDNIGVTEREMRIITSNGALVAFYGISKIIKALLDDDVSKLEEFRELADTFLSLDATGGMVSSVVGKESIIQDILDLAMATGSIVREHKMDFKLRNGSMPE